MTKLRNNELPSAIAADLVNYVISASVYTYEQFVSYRVELLAMGKNADCGFVECTIRKHENANKTLTQTIGLTLTLSLTVFTRCNIRISPEAITTEYCSLKLQMFRAGRVGVLLILQDCV